MKIALVAPHIFMWDKVLKDNIFAPGDQAILLSNRLSDLGHKVTLYSAGPVRTKSRNEHIALKSIENELKKHGDFPELIKSDLETFRQLFKVIELEILVKAFSDVDEYDVTHVHITNGPEGPLFSKILKKPILFTLHDSFKLNFPNPESYKFIKNVKFSAISKNQKIQVPELNILGTVHNGIQTDKFLYKGRKENYFLSYGRIIKPKGVHTAIKVCRETKTKLKIAGLHYEGHGGDAYWSTNVKPFIDGTQITYEGYIKDQKIKNALFGKARALLFPIEWEEPFGLVLLEANSCGTPVIAFNRGSVPEIIKNGINGYIVSNESEMIDAMNKIDNISRQKCRDHVVKNFGVEKMVAEYEKLYEKCLSAD
ncbi:MAG: glycosyltransferase [Candidatus Dojkabacteria bacterium]|nr:glycosyltransferase [Candidatus Dojkabacteria bacterium]